MSHERFMMQAIEAARKGIEEGQTPFGSCIVKDGEVVACAHNTVWKDTDITAHAEMNAIREACRALDTVDLSGCAIYSTTEPCTMCFSAIHWARLSTIVYGAQIRDAKEFGFSELHIPNEKMRELAGSGMELVEDVLREECMELFRAWSAGSVKKVY
jgi:tRNA(Arg) A34 adenosine deaminase TadA